jgi:hypothetical protein
MDGVYMLNAYCGEYNTVGGIGRNWLSDSNVTWNNYLYSSVSQPDRQYPIQAFIHVVGSGTPTVSYSLVFAIFKPCSVIAPGSSFNWTEDGNRATEWGTTASTDTCAYLGHLSGSGLSPVSLVCPTDVRFAGGDSISLPVKTPLAYTWPDYLAYVDAATLQGTPILATTCNTPLGPYSSDYVWHGCPSESPAQTYYSNVDRELRLSSWICSDRYIQNVHPLIILAPKTSEKSA